MLYLLVALTLIGAADDEATFEREVRPVLAGACVRCHGPLKSSGGLRLDSRAAILKGGESGPAIVPGRPDASLLVEAIRRGDDAAAMPPDAALPADSVKALERWIAGGARWPKGGAPVASAVHWAFRPVAAVEPPGPGHPIDAFLAAGHRAKGLRPVGPADRRTLIRRVTFDLTGLPPTPEEIRAFLDDGAADAYPRLVDRLLGSPAYGEAWGRAWLDVARYADTAGETADFPVPDAWRYRDYVIDAFNADVPYDRFVREQIAGDLLAGSAPPDRHAALVAATGYLAVARRFGFDVSKDHHLTIDDAIDTMTTGLLGLTVACARCHDHKYDPISAADYYALYGILDSTRFPFPGCEKDPAPRDNVPLVSPAEAARRAAPIRVRLADAEARLARAEAAVESLAERTATSLGSGAIPNGGRQEIGPAGFRPVAVRKGETIRLTIAPKGDHGADSTRVELTIAEPREGGRSWSLARDTLAAFAAKGNPPTAWRFWDAADTPRLLTEVETVAEKTPGLSARRGSAWAPCVLANANDRPVAFQTVKQPARSLALHPGPSGAVVAAWESPIDGEVGLVGLVEDIDPTAGDGVAWSLELGPGLNPALDDAGTAVEAVAEARRALDAIDRDAPRAYALAEGTPHDARILERGDPETLGPVVPRGFLAVLGGAKVPPGAGSGRLQLAGWIADPANPLTARVMVNRVWARHFGNGLVRTPNNFGARGEPPTHPELLDWLAARFVADGWSIKRLHRTILSSDAYRRSTADDSSNAAIDPANLGLWRFDRRRLSAEEIRDAMLAVSGDLAPRPDGPHPFPPPPWKFTQHAPFVAVYDHDRRGVYLMTQRIKRHPFLALFDGADPNASTPARGATTVPTQALYFMNDPAVHARAASLARRLAPLPDDDARLDRACALLYGRPPREADRRAFASFLASYGTPGEPARAAWLRVMLASNEFLYVD